MTLSRRISELHGLGEYRGREKGRNRSTAKVDGSFPASGSTQSRIVGALGASGGNSARPLRFSPRFVGCGAPVSSRIPRYSHRSREGFVLLARWASRPNPTGIDPPEVGIMVGK